MAKLVLVHGAFNELWGPNELKARWLPALRDGLWHHGATVDDDDVAVCFYGDLFRARPGVDDDAAISAARRVVEGQLHSADTSLTDRLDAEVAAGFFERTIDLVARLVADPTLAQRAFARLTDQISEETTVVVAHSLGTVVANRVLTMHPDLPVRTLVTLGCPLGSPNLPPLPAGPPTWPGGIERWVNVAAVGDKVAEPGRLADVIDPRIEDHAISNGRRAHDPEPYLNSVVTGEAVASALGLLEP